MKGIAPFIALALVIGLTLTVGVLLSNWIIPFLGEQRNEVSDRSDRLFDCSKAKIFFEKNSLTANGTRLTVKVENRGSVNLTDFVLYISLNNSSFVTFDRATNYNITLQPSQQTILINTTTINKSNITIATLSTGPNDKCPSTKWEADFT